MWSDIGSLRSFSHTLMWATAIFAILAAIATGVRYYVDQRVSELVSVARNAAAEIKEKAQSEREAALQAKLEAAEQEQREASGKLHAKVENAEKEQRESSAKLVELQERNKPRAFSKWQEERFVSVMSGCVNKQVAITAPIGDPEAISFATLLDSLFKTAGWTTGGVSQSVFTGVPVGIILRVPNKEQVHPCLATLQKTLMGFGFQAPAEIVPDTLADRVDIVVGHKP